jgi:hypothetical protein
MKTIKTTPEELHSFLILASTVLKKESRASMTALRALHNIPSVVLDVIVAEGAISLKGTGRAAIWKWTGDITPSREIAEIILLKVRKGKALRAAERKKQMLKKGEKIVATFLDGGYDSGQKQFDAILAGEDPFAVKKETPLAVSAPKPAALVPISAPKAAALEPVYKAEHTEATTKEALVPLKKKSYGITKVFFGLISIRTNYYE